MFGRVLAAFGLGVRSQLQPAMLGLLAIPFVLALVVWALSAWLAWTPLIDWLRAHLFESTGAMRWLQGWMASIGVTDFGGFASALIALLLLLPLMFATGLMLVSVLAMPYVVHRLSRGDYADVEARGSWAILPSLTNAITGFLIFLVGYVVTMPLWLIPPLAFVVPWIWWSWLAARLMRLDSLVEHADPAERTRLIRRYRFEYVVLGLAVSILNYIPPLFLITPVLSALVFVHFSLSRLREQRRLIPDGRSAPIPVRNQAPGQVR